MPVGTALVDTAKECEASGATTPKGHKQDKLDTILRGRDDTTRSSSRLCITEDTTEG